MSLVEFRKRSNSIILTKRSLPPFSKCWVFIIFTWNNWLIVMYFKMTILRKVNLIIWYSVIFAATLYMLIIWFLELRFNLFHPCFWIFYTYNVCYIQSIIKEYYQSILKLLQTNLRYLCTMMFKLLYFRLRCTDGLTIRLI